jgi:hypothetical protein
MFNWSWSPAEKRIARAAYDKLVEAALAKTIAEFKAKVAAISSASQMWEMHDYLRDESRYLGEMLLYRYSTVPMTFAWAIREGYLEKAALSGLSADKLDKIFLIAKDL